MINISNIDVYNFENAFRGLRNPMNSWNKSDSYWTGIQEDVYNQNFIESKYIIGPNDLNLAQRMIKGGSSESKFLRQIFVSMDIDAPLYWWKEMDQYRIGCTTNSCSTMHKIASSPITKECFSFDNENLTKLETEEYLKCKDAMENIVQSCEWLRQQYLKTKDKRYWRELIQILPSAWMQKRTWTANYQVLRKIYQERLNHKLVEWHEFCKAIMELPYAENLIII